MDDQKLVDLIGPLLFDPVKAVRIEAAQRLAGHLSQRLSSDQRKVFSTALGEYEKSMLYSADFAFGRYNLANLYAARGRPEEAIRNYQAAIRIDGLFYPAKVNLAMLHNQRGENTEAETLLREVVKAHPDLYDVAYSLGLLLAETKQYDDAAVFLKKASEGLPERARIQYNLGLLLQHLNQDPAAEVALTRALKLEPDNMDYLYALADFYIKREQWQKAEGMAKHMVAKHPDHPLGHRLLKSLNNDAQNE
jgi:tetratricopeptide (TPR) repeat protein